MGFDADIISTKKQQFEKTRTDEIIEIAKRVQNEVQPDNFDTVFNAIIQSVYPR